MSLTTIYLPSIIKQGVDQLKLPPPKAGKVLFMLACIIGKYRKQNITFDDFIPISSDYKIDILNTKDYSFVNSILENHFLEKMYLEGFKTYSTKKNICKHYRLRKKYRSLELCKYEIIYKRQKQKRQIEKFVVSKTKDLLKRNITLDIDCSLDEYLDQVFSDPQFLQETKTAITTQMNLSDSKQIKFIHYTNDKAIPKKQPFSEILRSKLKTETLVCYEYRKKKRYFLIDKYNADAFAQKMIDEKKASHKYTLLKIQDQDYYCDISKTNNRLHTNLSELASIHLEKIKIDGESIYSFDLKNSQLTLLAELLQKAISSTQHCEPKNYKYINKEDKRDKKGLKGNEIENKRIEGKSKEGKEGNKPLTSLFLQHTLNVCKPNNCPNVKSVEIFIEKCKNGTIYEYIYFKLFGDLCSRLPNKKITKEQRQKIKIIVFEILFSGYWNKSENVQKFKKHFPNVYEIITNFKRDCKAGFDKELESIKKKLGKNSKLSDKQIHRFALAEFKEKHGATTAKLGSNQLAIMLQTYESSIFISKILYKLLKKNIVCFSKHDSILFKASDLETVRALIVKELDKQLGKDSYKLALESTDKLTDKKGDPPQEQKQEQPPKGAETPNAPKFTDTLKVKKDQEHSVPKNHKINTYTKYKQLIPTKRKNKKSGQSESQEYGTRYDHKKRLIEAMKQTELSEAKEAETEANDIETEINELFAMYEKSKIECTGKGYGKGEAIRIRQQIREFLE